MYIKTKDLHIMSQDSSIGTATRIWVRQPRNWGRFLAEARHFSLCQNCHIGSGPSSFLTTEYQGSFPGGKIAEARR
jgi:hypothetical protein